MGSDNIKSRRFSFINRRELLDRIARINASVDWAGDINPTQRAALSYLARANRFSRAPSQTATYLNATRGTTSQTLKALARKGLVIEQRSDTDKRSISYDVTKEGIATLKQNAANEDTIDLLSKLEITDLTANLRNLIKKMLKVRGGRSFGLCSSCRHHMERSAGAYCSLLSENLSAKEKESICYEHEAA